MLHSIRIQIAVALTVLGTTFLATAQGTAFTYQGRLTSGGSPANGSYDVAFTLFDTSADGAILAGPVTNTTVSVTNGLFTTLVDFGNAFTGTSNWLELAVSTNGANAFSTLTPRQQLTPTPYAVFASSASNVVGMVSASQLSGSIPATTISGTLTTAQLPTTVVTNNASSVALNGAFSGNGSGITNINLASITSSGSIGATAVGSGNFVLSATLGAGISPAAVVATDVNGDGKLDLVCANNGPNNQNGSLMVYTNDGAGHFVLAATLTTGIAAVSVAAADLNGDGKVDLVSANFGGGTLTVFTNTGTGQFAFSATLSVGSYPEGVIATDVNGDGMMDLVTASYGSGALIIHTNDGTGHFAQAATVGLGGGAYGVTAADVNNDGKMDLIGAVYGNNNLVVVTNNGAGNFAVASTPGVGLGPVSSTAVDVNGDGKVDLISVNASISSLTVLTNDGTGKFTYSATLGSGPTPRAVAAVDINGDGLVDLVCADSGSNILTILTNSPTGQFSLFTTITTGYAPTAIAAVDINGDGAVDLIDADHNGGSVTVLTNMVKYLYAYNGSFTGNGGGLTNLNASLLTSGTIPLARLPGAVVTNAETGVTLSGSFSGNGTGLTNLNASQITSGTLPQAQLPSAAVTNTQTGVTLSGTFNGTHTGNGSGLTNVNAVSLGGIRLTNDANGIELNTIFNANSHPLFLKGAGDSNHGIGHANSVTNFTQLSPPDGPVVWGATGGALGYVSPTNGIALAWNAAGLTISAATATGPGAQFNFYDRGGVATYGQWSYYAYSGRAYFWLSTIGNRMSIDSSGNVRAAGTFTASTTPDLAETIPAADNVEAGDIVSANPERAESVVRCDRHSPAVLGVISDGTSGFIINAHAKSVDAPLTGKPLVLAGRVPVKVSLENGPIKIGDSLSPSSTPGVAMRADGSGTVIGIALAPYDAGHQTAWGQPGKVLCFVKLGDSTAASKIKQLETQNNDLTERLQKLENLVRSLESSLSSRPVP